MTESLITIDRRDAVAEIVLNNPAKRNAISAAMWDRLRSIAGSAREDRTLRAIILRGAEKTFSAGADITGFEAGRTGQSATAYDDLVEMTARAFEELPQIVVAAIEGPCIGAGATLACACDFRVAETDGFFAVPAARLGLGYDPRGIERFWRVFGQAATRELVLLGERMSAPRAHTLGAVSRLTGPGDAIAQACQIAEAAASLAPLTQQAAKLALSELAAGKGVSSAALELAARADESQDYHEGQAAFAAKRSPKFTGL